MNDIFFIFHFIHFLLKLTTDNYNIIKTNRIQNVMLLDILSEL